MITSQQKEKIAFTKTLASVFGNLAAGWFGLVFVAPNFLPITGWHGIFLLIANLFWGTLCLWTAFKLERRLL